MTELVVLNKIKPLDLFTPEGTTDILERIRKEAKSFVLDISTEKGREHIRSLAYRIARSKTLLDDMGKELVAEQKKQLTLVDVERKRIRDELDALKEEIRAPLTEWENNEKRRVEAHEAALKTLESLSRFDAPHPASAEVQKRLEAVETANTRDWQEFGKRAQLAYDAASKALSETLAASQKYEAEQAELERLRREEAERKARERDEQIKAEAAAKAKAEAEEKARKEAEAEAVRVKAEQEKAEQERMRIQKEKEEAEARAMKAEEDRLAAIAKAEADRKAAEEKAKRDAEEAARKERERIEAEKKAEAEAAARREADKKHRAKINNEILNALVTSCNSETVDVTPEIAKAVVEAVAKGQIPHIKISY